MIRNVWSILCRDILTDQETNSVSYIRCIEEGAASILPTNIFPVNIGTLWEKDTDYEERLYVRVIFVSPSGAEQVLLQTRDLKFSRPRQRLHLQLERLSISEFGRHELRVEAYSGNQWAICSRLPFTVRKLAHTLSQPSGKIESLAG